MTRALIAGLIACTATVAQAADKPNIVVIMGDDIGMWNIGAYHRLMAGTTPNIDQLAAEGAIFTDFYAEASGTAGYQVWQACQDGTFFLRGLSLSLRGSCPSLIAANCPEDLSNRSGNSV